jgi:diguanylate cyclase (GGDEF)-like protein
MGPHFVPMIYRAAMDQHPLLPAKTGARAGASKARAIADRAWAGYAVVAVLIAVGYFAVPTSLQSEWIAAGAMLAPLAIATGVIVHRPSRRAHLWFLCAGVFLLALGDLIWALLEDVGPAEVRFPSLADVSYLGAYPFIVVSMLLIVHRRRARRDVTNLLDVAVLSLGVGLAMWVLLIDPLARAESDAAAGAVSAAYPAIDLALIALAARLAFAGGRRVPAYWALVAALVITVIADIAYGLGEVTGSYSTGSWIDSLYLLAYGCWGVVGLHPSMRDLHTRTRTDRRSRVVSAPRIALLGAASLAAPGVLTIQLMRHATLHLPVVIAVSAVLFVLVVMRLAVVMRELSDVASHDSLTGLPNRVALTERLGDLLRVSPPGQLAVFFVDLDRFKDVNDSLGHAAGDRLLAEVAARLRLVLRAPDLVARFGGDEFVIAAAVRDASEAGRIADRVLECLAEPIWLEGAPVFPGASVGVAIATGATVDPEHLVADADAAMFRAKARGRACYEVFDETMRGGGVERLTVEADLRDAIVRNELRVHYQPIAALPDRRVIGYEALLRWHRPDGEIRVPAAFLSIAEETGLIVPIGELVLDAVLTDLGATVDADPRSTLFVSVNLSGRQLLFPGLVDNVRDALARHGTHPARIYLEVSEHALIDEDAAGVLNDLRALGVGIAMDEFGTGYSSLQQLRRTRFDAIKIDQSYIAALGDPDDRAIVQAIFAMIQALGIYGVAEGVETEAQLETLGRLGCQLVQGHLIGEPRPHLPGSGNHDSVHRRDIVAVASHGSEEILGMVEPSTPTR